MSSRNNIINFFASFVHRSGEYDDKDVMLLTDDELRQSYIEALESYTRGTGSDWGLVVPDIDDAMIVAYERDYIHDLIQKAHRRNIELVDSFDSLKKADTRWQEWLLECIKTDMLNRSAIYVDSTKPKEKWWLWIEELDKLTLAERSTL